MATLNRRPATASDAEFAREVHHRAYQDVVSAQFGGWDEAEQDRFFAETWTRFGHEILLCDGVPCGYIGIDTNTEFIELRELVILPAFQGRGLGSAILTELTARARGAGIPLRLRVLIKNRAVSLYGRFGFRETGVTATHRLMEFDQKL